MKNIKPYISDGIPAFVILLERDKDRSSHVYKDIVPRLDSCQVIAATDADGDDIEVFMQQCLKPISIDDYAKYSRPKFACTISHIRVWQRIVESNLEHAIVLEDDVVIDDGFEAFVRELKDQLPSTYDLAHLYIHPDFQSDWSRGADLADRAFVEFVPRWGRSAYLLSQTGAKKLLDLFEHVAHHGDMQIAQMAQRGDLSVYCASKMHVQNLGQMNLKYNGERFRSTVHPKTE